MTPEVEQRHNDLQNTIDKLSNGHRGDPLAMSEGIVNISKTLQVMLKMNYVTKDECIASHSTLIEDVKKAKFSWKQLAAVLIACSTLFGLGTHLINTVWDKPDVIIQSPVPAVVIDPNAVPVQQ